MYNMLECAHMRPHMRPDMRVIRGVLVSSENEEDLKKDVLIGITDRIISDIKIGNIGALCMTVMIHMVMT